MNNHPEDILSLLVLIMIVLVTLFFIVWNTPIHDKFDNYRKERRINSGKQKSDAYETGYLDMAKALGPSVYWYTIDALHGRMSIHSCSAYRKLAENYTYQFDPKSGRTSKYYMSTTNSEKFQEYYAGGLQLLSDVDEVQGRLIEEKEMIRRRQEGLKEADHRIMTTKLELDKLRNKAFANDVDKLEFEKKMSELEGAPGWFHKIVRKKVAS